MTRPVQKKRERFFAEEAARSLGKSWSLSEDREHPDFIVTEGDQSFGLEVRQIFMGALSRSPSIGAFWAISVRLPDMQIIDFARVARPTPCAVDK